MSAYIVDNVTINRIVAMLHEATDFGGKTAISGMALPTNAKLVVHWKYTNQKRGQNDQASPPGRDGQSDLETSHASVPRLEF